MVKEENASEEEYNRLYRKVMNTLNDLGINDGIPPINVGDRVRVNYLGDEDAYSNQLREGVVENITLTQDALDANSPLPLIYTVETNKGKRFETHRWSLDKIA